MTEPKILLDKAEHSLRTVDHIIYITYPLIKENRLLKKVIEQLYEIANNIIEAVLEYESMYKRIQMPKQDHFETFKNKCSAKFNINSEEIGILKELFEIMKKHQESSFEFSRKEKLVIMLNNSRTESIGIEQLKKYLNILKIMLKKTQEKINKPI